MWESPSHEKGGTIGGKVHGMTQSGRLEGFAEGFGPEGSAMVCAAGGFIRFPFSSLVGNCGGGSIRIATHTGVHLH